jgi:hypothetical protein
MTDIDANTARFISQKNFDEKKKAYKEAASKMLRECGIEIEKAANRGDFHVYFGYPSAPCSYNIYEELQILLSNRGFEVEITNTHEIRIDWKNKKEIK